ncbi:MAG: hypothetical protein R3C01_08110 [Planctomycetaceae bacterium]
MSSLPPRRVRKKASSRRRPVTKSKLPLILGGAAAGVLVLGLGVWGITKMMSNGEPPGAQSGESVAQTGTTGSPETNATTSTKETNATTSTDTNSPLGAGTQTPGSTTAHVPTSTTTTPSTASATAAASGRGGVSSDLFQPTLQIPCVEQVNALAFSTDGTSIGAACDDGVWRTWKSADKTLTFDELVEVPTSSSTPATQIQFGSNDLVFGGDAAGAIVMFETSTRRFKQIHRVKSAVQDLQFSRDRKHLCFTGKEGGPVYHRLLDESEPLAIGKFRAPYSPLMMLENMRQMVTATEDHDVTIRSLVGEEGGALMSPGLGPLRSVAATTDGKTLMAVGDEPVLVVMNTSDSNNSQRIPLPAPASRIQLSPDSQLLAIACTSADGSSGGLYLTDFQGSGNLTPLTDRPVRAVAWSPDGTFLSADTGEVIQVWKRTSAPGEIPAMKLNQRTVNTWKLSLERAPFAPYPRGRLIAVEHAQLPSNFAQLNVPGTTLCSIPDKQVCGSLKGLAVYEPNDLSTTDATLTFEVVKSGPVYLLAKVADVDVEVTGTPITRVLDLWGGGWTFLASVPWDQKEFLYYRPCEAGEKITIRTHETIPPRAMIAPVVDVFAKDANIDLYPGAEDNLVLYSVIRRFQNKDWDWLESTAANLRKHPRYTGDGSHTLELFYKSFAPVGPKTRDVFVSCLNQLYVWDQARKDSDTVKVAAGWTMIEYAEAARSGAITLKTGEDVNTLYQQLHQFARNGVIVASKTMKNDAILYCCLMRGGFSQQMNLDQMMSILEMGLKADPTYVEIVGYAALLQLPKWGGQPGGLSFLADRAALLTKDDVGEMMYAVVFNVTRDSNQTLMLNQPREASPRLDWERAKQGYRDFIKHTRRPHLANTACYVAWRAKDKPYMVEMRPFIGDKPDITNVWNVQYNWTSFLKDCKAYTDSLPAESK